MLNHNAAMEIPISVMEGWQIIVDILAEIVGVPSALIMRLNDPDIEVFVSSRSENNPYHAGDKEYFDCSGLYCETVVKTRKMLLVPNALKDEQWKNNPDVKVNMISYLGFPIQFPDGTPFGTICVLDNKENLYSATFEKLILKFRNLIQENLGIMFMNQVLGDKNRKLLDYLKELQALRGIVPICANCKSIRDAQGNWKPIEHYILRNPNADFSHSICPLCMKKLYPEYDIPSKPDN